MKSKDGGWQNEGYTCDDVFFGIDKQPTVDPVKHGHWMCENLRSKTAMFDCPVCGKTCYDLSGRGKHGEKSVCNYRYCPWCGAKMDERFGNSEQLEE